MFTPTSPSDQPETPRGRESQHCAITDGKIAFLWWFIHGNIVTPESWNALLQAYVLCERHAWARLSVEMSFSERHFLGPVTHNQALVEKSFQAIETRHGIGLRSPERPLQGKRPCFLCVLNIRHAGAGAAPPTPLALGRDSSCLGSFAIDRSALWPPKVCAVCRGAVSRPSRRRPPLLPDLKSRQLADLFWQQATLEKLPVRFAGYDESFVAAANASTDHDPAALVSGTGWFSAWHPLVALPSNSA